MKSKLVQLPVGVVQPKQRSDPMHYFTVSNAPTDFSEFSGNMARLINEYKFVTSPVELPLPEAFVKQAGEENPQT